MHSAQDNLSLWGNIYRKVLCSRFLTLLRNNKNTYIHHKLQQLLSFVATLQFVGMGSLLHTTSKLIWSDPPTRHMYISKETPIFLTSQILDNFTCQFGNAILCFGYWGSCNNIHYFD